MNAAEFTTRVDRYWDGLYVFAGPAFGCHECNLEDTMSDDADAQERYDSACDSHFSWRKCPSCGGLASDRHAVHYQDIAGEGFSGHEDVCTDCLMYLANGDVPEDD